MRVLVTFGSKRGGTEGIARVIGDALAREGVEAVVRPVAAAGDPSHYDAVIVGGALYMMRWHRDAARFVARHARALRRVPVWLFSSGPLDESAAQREIAPTAQVRRLMARVGAQGHATFGGRLAPDATGFLARKMAATHSGDWRDARQIEDWARSVAEALPTARPLGEPAPAGHAIAWGLLVVLDLFVAATALYGGGVLVARPDGSLLEMSTSILAHSPFHSFLVPGLLLLVVIGGGSFTSGVLALARRPPGALASFVSGLALMVWITVEVLLLASPVHWLQWTFLAIGAAITADALYLERRPSPRLPTELRPHAA